MQITGEQLFFLVQVLRDSLDIQMGYDWSFRKKRDERKQFYENFIYTILSQKNIDIKDLDLTKLKGR
jgi:hypothetical protein